MTTWEIIERGEELYQTKIRVHVETEANQGKFVVLDTLTGDFELHLSRYPLWTVMCGYSHKACPDKH